MIARSVGEQYVYVMLEDRKRPESEQTRFHFQVLDLKTHAKLTRAMQKFINPDGTFDVQSVDMGELTSACVQAIREGLTDPGWENLCDPDGEQIPFELEKDGKASTALLKHWFRADQLQELAGVAQSNDFLTEDDLKNSPSPRR